MVKIAPINNLLTKSIKNLSHTKMVNPVTIPLVSTAVAGAGIASTLPMIFSNNYKDFTRTVDEDNYFQLKTNPETGKPFQADVFQKTSANHLFNNDDVVVTAPTGTGKTAIAEYVMTKNLKEGKATNYTTPMKAWSNEKLRDFSKI